jgi:hypothetical protein
MDNLPEPMEHQRVKLDFDPKVLIDLRKRYKPNIWSFLKEYCVTGDIEKAARKARLSKKNPYLKGLKLLADPGIQKLLDMIEYEIKLQFDIKLSYFIYHLKNIIESEDSRNADKISALQLLARLTGQLKEASIENNNLVILKCEPFTAQNIESTARVIDIEEP